MSLVPEPERDEHGNPIFPRLPDVPNSHTYHDAHDEETPCPPKSCPSEPRRTIHDIATAPRADDVIRLFAGLVVYRVRFGSDRYTGGRVSVDRIDTPPSGPSRSASEATCIEVALSVWSDLCRAACSWEPSR